MNLLTRFISEWQERKGRGSEEKGEGTGESEGYIGGGQSNETENHLNSHKSNH